MYIYNFQNDFQYILRINSKLRITILFTMHTICDKINSYVA